VVWQSAPGRGFDLGIEVPWTGAIDDPGGDDPEQDEMTAQPQAEPRSMRGEPR
jgi:hypothetical protein